MTLGARYEDYRQVSAEFNPLALTSPILPGLNTSEFTENEFPPGIFQDDDVYPSLSLKYTIQDFWAEDFNLRFNWGETAIRPDLREIVNTSYRDAITDAIIQGNSSTIPSDVTHVDLRAEWFFVNGNSFTVSLFQKDIDNPIESFPLTTAAGNEQRATIQNGDTAEVAGVEIEWLVSLEFLGDFGSQFFLQGNMTSLTENEVDVTNSALNDTNLQRPLAQASDFIGNLVLGYDSDDGKHSAGLAFNTFSERLYIPGDGGQEDSFEQPFNSLDLTYTYFITDDFTVKFKAKNLLDEKSEFFREDDEGNDIVVFEEEGGQSFSLGVSYNF